MSGGQDSTYCLSSELRRVDQVTALLFDYGQRHHIELAQATALCDDLGVESKLIRVQLPDMNTALIGTGDVKAPSAISPTLPASFVPGRNAMFLSIAYGYAVATKAARVVTGVCQTDYSGYPDCRIDFINRMEDTLSTCYGVEGNRPTISTPLMDKTKAQTWEMAYDIDCLHHALRSRTCYIGASQWNGYGSGCGECPACGLRSAGFDAFYANADSKTRTRIDRISRSVHPSNTLAMFKDDTTLLQQKGA